MANMNMGGVVYPGMMQQQQLGQSAQNNMGYGTGYGAQAQMGHAMYGQVNQQNQLMYGGAQGAGMTNGNFAMPQANAYNAMPGNMMQSQNGMNANMWAAGSVPSASVSGHTLSKQLWK